MDNTAVRVQEHKETEDSLNESSATMETKQEHEPYLTEAGQDGEKTQSAQSSEIESQGKTSDKESTDEEQKEVKNEIELYASQPQDVQSDKTQFQAEQSDTEQLQEVLHGEESQESQKAAQLQEEQVSKPQLWAMPPNEVKSDEVKEGEDQLQETQRNEEQLQDGEESTEALESEEQSENCIISWMTADVLRDAFTAPSEGKKEYLAVTDLHAEPAVGQGDNYSSVMMRVRVDVMEDDERGGRQPGQRNIVVKCRPNVANPFLREMGQMLFSNEERVYRETLPRMHTILREKVRGTEFVQLAPRAFLYSGSGNLIFEDLNSLGFKMADRITGLDLQHSLLALRALGTFHALSMALYEEDPALVDFEELIYAEKFLDKLQMWIPKGFETLAQNVKKWRGFQQYASRILEYGKGVVDVFLTKLANTEERFKVLNHGDFWVNNMMFRYSETTGEPVDIRLLDFQACRFVSLAMDLQYFIYSSPRADIRSEKLDEMISAYHSTLGKTLVKLRLPHRMMSRQELDRELERFHVFGVMTAVSVLPVALAEPKNALDLESLMDDTNKAGNMDVISNILARKSYVRAVKLLLPYWDKKDYI